MGLLSSASSDAIPFDRNSFSAVTAAVILGTVGASTILVMPGLLGVIVVALGLSEQQLGFVASVDVFTMAVALGVTAFLLNKFSWRALAVISLVILALGNLASLFSTDYSAILWSRALAGVGEGVAVGVSFAALGVTRNPDRSFGIYLVFALLFSSVALYAFPLLVDTGGYRLVFGLLVMLCLLNLVFIPWLTPKAQPSDLHSEPRIPICTRTVGLGLVMVTLFFIAQGAVWSYLERIGMAKDLEAQLVGTALALSALAGIVGAGIAMLVGNRCARAIPITSGILVQVVSMVMLLSDLGEAGFIVAVMLFNFSWNLCQAYFSGIMSEIDGEGRVVVLMGSIQTFGVAGGPFLAALLIRPGNLDPISYLGIVCVILALLATFLVLNRWKNHKNDFVGKLNTSPTLES